MQQAKHAALFVPSRSPHRNNCIILRTKPSRSTTPKNHVAYTFSSNASPILCPAHRSHPAIPPTHLQPDTSNANIPLLQNPSANPGLHLASIVRCIPCISNRAAALHNAYTTISLMIAQIKHKQQLESENLTQMVKFLASAAECAKANGSFERSTYLRQRVRVEMGIYEKRKGDRDTDLKGVGHREKSKEAIFHNNCRQAGKN